MPASRKAADKDIFGVDIVLPGVLAYMLYGKRSFNKRGIVRGTRADSVAEQENIQSCGK